MSHPLLSHQGRVTSGSDHAKNDKYWGQGSTLSVLSGSMPSAQQICPIVDICSETNILFKHTRGHAV